MKKILIFLSLSLSALISCSQTFIQTIDYCYDCPLSLEFGPVVSHISGIKGAMPLMGYNIGFSQITDEGFRWQSQTKLSFISSRAKVKGYERNLSMLSIFISIQIRYYLTRWGKSEKEFYLFSAPILGINGVSGYMYHTNPQIPELFNRLLYWHGILKDFSYNMSLGVGYGLTRNIDLNLYMIYSFTNIHKIEKWHRYILNASIEFWFNK